MFLPEAFLNGMKIFFRGETFDGCDGTLANLNGEHRARLHGFAVQQDGTGAADRGFAADMSSGESGDIAEKMHEEKSRLNFGAVFDTINLYGDSFFHRDPAVRLEFIRRDLRGGER